MASDATNTDYVLSLSATEINEIGNALVLQPYKNVAGIISHINKQISEQNAQRKSAPQSLSADSERNRSEGGN